MASPFTWNVAKPAVSDVVANFPTQVAQPDKTTLENVLGTLNPFGTTTTGWRANQLNDSLWAAQNAAVTALLPSPGTPTLTASTTGGSLATGTVYVKVTALDTQNGLETAPSSEASVSVTGPSASVAVSWTAVSGAGAYRVYVGSTTGGENNYFQTTSTSYTVTTLTGTSGTPPSATLAGSYNRDDTTKAALAFATDPSLPAWRWLYAAGAANPITWTEVMRLTSAGVLSAPSIALGATPAQTGAVRLTINQGVFSRNVPNNGDVQLMLLDLSGDLRLGDSTVNAIRPTNDLTTQLGYSNVRFTNLYTASLFSVNATNLANYLQVQGAATGSPPTITAAGSDTNVGLNLVPKGTGVVAATGPLQAGTASANSLQLLGAATGVAPQVQALGSDTNIGINFVTKGTGQVTVNGNPIGANPTLVLKKGSGNGTHYTTTSTTYVDIDSTNLAYTVTVPVGQKVLINASLTYWVAGTSSPTFAITDGTTLLTEVVGEQQGQVNLLASVAALTYIFVGDGASHTFKLRFGIGSSSNTLTVDNLTSVQTPMMTFWMGPAN
jgi:hypothetical protein